MKSQKSKDNFMHVDSQSDDIRQQKIQRQKMIVNQQLSSQYYNNLKKQSSKVGVKGDSQQESFFQKHKEKQGLQRKTVKSTQIIPYLFSYVKRVKMLPTSLVQHLRKRLEKYNPNNQLIYFPFYPEDLNFSVRTKEGKAGVIDLIKYLQTLESKQSDNTGKEVKVQWSDQLHRAAAKRVQAIQNGNARVQGLDVGELVNQFTYWKSPLFEMVVYGFLDPKQILIEAFLEDDSHLKSNRLEFFNQGSKYVGIDMGYHKEYKIVTVIIFAGGVSKLTSIKQFSMNNNCQCIIY